MTYLDNTTQKNYYEGRNFGSYQFVSLEDIINQFMVVYTGEDKLIPRARRMDVAFHAQRALAELSFDTFKSIKAHQIDLPPSLTMILPHDYVNYTKMSWADAAGIKHPLYPTRHTSNPFQIRQDDNGQYDFSPLSGTTELAVNGRFDDGLRAPWYFAGQKFWHQRTTKVIDDATVDPNPPTDPNDPNYNITQTVSVSSGFDGVDKGDMIKETDGIITFIHSSHAYGRTAESGPYGRAQVLYQEIDVSGIDYLDLSASATTRAATTKTWDLMGNTSKFASNVDLLIGGNMSFVYDANFPNNSGYQAGFWDGYTEIIDAYNVAYDTDLLSSDTNSALADDLPATTVRIGICSQLPDWNGEFQLKDTTYTATNAATGETLTYGEPVTILNSPEIFDLADTLGNPSYREWEGGNNNGEKEVNHINVIDHDTVFVVVVSLAPFNAHAFVGELGTLSVTNLVDDISVKSYSDFRNLTSPTGNEEQSSTWKNYKSGAPNENKIVDTYDYDDNRFEFNIGQRFGLEPTHTQTNGSFFIDDRLGKIHFSSNVSGKTVILDYISDSLGTEAEMKVHKLAEEAMYNWIAYGVLCSRSNVPEYIINRFRRRKSAETRKAKLRLSNIKLEEITQALRGKSKHLKH